MPKQHYSLDTVERAYAQLKALTPKNAHVYILIQATAPSGTSHRVEVYAVTPATDAYRGEHSLRELTDTLNALENRARSNYGRSFTLRCLRENIGECVVRAITKQTGAAVTDLTYSYL